MTLGDLFHKANAKAELGAHQSEGFGARQWTKRFRAPQSPKTLKQNWIAKVSGALSLRLHNSKTLIISINVVLVIALLLLNAATLHRWPALIEALYLNNPHHTADQTFHKLTPKLLQMDTWRNHNAQLKAHTDQIDVNINGQITLFGMRGQILAQTSLHPNPKSQNNPENHHISPQSFSAIQPETQSSSDFTSLEQLLSAAIHKTL